MSYKPKGAVRMMKPMTKKLLLGIPTVTLSAVLACTLAGCGGSAPSGSAGSSGGSAPVQEKTEKPKAYESQTVEAAGIVYESVAHGTFYRGDAKKRDGFYLHIEITNNNTKNRTFDSFNVHAAQGDLEAGDPLFTSGKAAVLDYVASEVPMSFTRASIFPRGQISARARPLSTCIFGRLRRRTTGPSLSSS